MCTPFRMLSACLICVLVATSAGAQQPVWSVRIDEPVADLDYGRHFVVDDDGSIYVCGVNYVGWVVWKLDPSGNLLWTWNEGVPNSGHLVGNRIGICADGSVVIFGRVSGWLSGSAIVRLSPDGERLSLRTHPYTPTEDPIASINSQGQIAFATYRDGAARLVLFDRDGELLWDREHAPSVGFTPRVKAVHFGPDGTLYLGLSVRAQPDEPSERFTVARYSVTGEMLSNFTVSSAGTSDILAALAVDSVGRIAAAGSRTQPGNSSGALTVLLSPGGDVLWQDYLADPNLARRASRVIFDSERGAVFAGGSSNLPGNYDNELFLIRIGLDGTRTWVQSTGVGTGSAVLGGIGVDESGNGYFVGNWSIDVDRPIIMRSYAPDGPLLGSSNYSSGPTGDYMVQAVILDSGDFVTMTPQLFDVAISRFDRDGTHAGRSVFGSLLGRRDEYPLATSDGVGGIYIVMNSPGEIDTRLVRMDGDGNTLWAALNTDLRRAQRIDCDPAGNALLFGEVRGGDSYGDPGVIRVSPTGDVVSVTRCPAYQGGTDGISGTAVDSSGNAYLTVWSEQYRPDMSSLYHYRFFKVSPDGQILFSVARRGAKLALDDNGLITAVGSGRQGDGPPQARITRYTPGGTILWERFFVAGTRETTAQHVRISSDGSIYVAGSISGPPSNAVLCLKYSPSGDLLWSQTVGEGWPRPPRAVDIALTADDTMVVGLTAFANDAFGSRPSDPGLAVVRSDGSIRSAALFPGLAADEAAEGIALDDAGWVYLFGGYAGYDPARGFLYRCDLDARIHWSTRLERDIWSSDYKATIPTDDGGVIAVASDHTLLTRADVLVTRFAPPPVCIADRRCLGDTDGDCAIGISDLAAVLSGFGTRQAAREAPFNGDVDVNGSVSLDDLAFVLSRFGEACE